MDDPDGHRMEYDYRLSDRSIFGAVNPDPGVARFQQCGHMIGPGESRFESCAAALASDCEISTASPEIGATWATTMTFTPQGLLVHTDKTWGAGRGGTDSAWDFTFGSDTCTGDLSLFE